MAQNSYNWRGICLAKVFIEARKRYVDGKTVVGPMQQIEFT